MTEHNIKLTDTAAGRFAVDVNNERNAIAGMRKAVIKVLGFTQVSLSEATGLSTVAVSNWCNNEATSHSETREKIAAALTVRYVYTYQPDGTQALPPFDNL